VGCGRVRWGGGRVGVVWGGRWGVVGLGCDSCGGWGEPVMRLGLGLRFEVGVGVGVGSGVAVPVRRGGVRLNCFLSSSYRSEQLARCFAAIAIVLGI
jgi:hypothetical protein